MYFASIAKENDPQIRNGELDEDENVTHSKWGDQEERHPDSQVQLHSSGWNTAPSDLHEKCLQHGVWAITEITENREAAEDKW